MSLFVLEKTYLMCVAVTHVRIVWWTSSKYDWLLLVTEVNLLNMCCQTFGISSLVDYHYLSLLFSKLSCIAHKFNLWQLSFMVRSMPVRWQHWALPRLIWFITWFMTEFMTRFITWSPHDSLHDYIQVPSRVDMLERQSLVCLLVKGLRECLTKKPLFFSVFNVFLTIEECGQPNDKLQNHHFSVVNINPSSFTPHFP